MNGVDVAIVGAGLSGALVASNLTQAGLRCQVLEAGPSPRRPLPLDVARLAERAAPLLAVDEDAWRYRNVRAGRPWFRVRAAGGRSLVWGGWCDAPSPENFEDARAFGAPWPLSFKELSAFSRRALALVGARRASVSAAAKRVSRALGVPVVHKVAATSARGERPFLSLDAMPAGVLRPRAVATRVVFAAGTATVRGIEWVDTRSGRAHFTASRAVVLCASPVESARLLWMSRDDATPGLGLAMLGQRLGDHLISSTVVVRSEPAPTSAAPGPLDATALLPRFVNARGGRTRDYRSGFVGEVRGPYSLATLDDAGLTMIGVNRHEAAAASYYSLHALGEAAPHARRRVRFDAEARDTFGRPIPIFEQALSAEDRLRARDMDETVDAVAGVLAGRTGRILVLRRAGEVAETGNESGGCAMGARAGGAVTDPRGRVFGARGLYVADGSLMPTALDRHPTLTLLALALRVADGIAREARGRDG